MDKIDNKYISNAIDELTSLLGVKDEVPYELIKKPFHTGNIRGCIEKIANYLGLPITVNLSYDNKFESSALAKTDRAGAGVESITAQVSIPSYIPLYGTSGLQGFPISVKISDNCQRHTETFMAIMAHELSHIVLHSLLHKEKDNEFYTDLTAMILGFSNVIRSGRKVMETKVNAFSTETLTTTYGYLSDEQFDFAFNRIDDILREYKDAKAKLLKKLTIYRQRLAFYRKELFKFNNFVKYLDGNQKKRIKSEDGAKIVEFHQLDYAKKFTVVVRSNEEKLKEINDFCKGLFHYTPARLNSLQNFNEEIDSLIAEIKRESDLLHDNVMTLRKYVGFFYKRKINRQSTLI